MPDKKHTDHQQRSASGHNPTGVTHAIAPRNQADPETRDSGNGTSTGRTDFNDRDRMTQNWLLVIFTGLIFVVTGVYSIFSYGQWASMEKALTETQKNRELEYRAYVGAKGVVFQVRADNPAWGDVMLITVNSGRTPIRDGKSTVLLEQRDAPPPDSTVVNESAHPGSKVSYIPMVEYSSYAGAIGTQVADALAKPQVAPTTQTQPSPTPIIPSLVPPEMPKFGDGWYVYGVINYNDIFDKPHLTKFCFFIAPHSRTFLQCPTFNDAN